MSGLRELVERVREADVAFAAESAACKKRKPSRSRCECERLRQLAGMRVLDVGKYVAAHPAILDAYDAVGALGEALQAEAEDAAPEGGPCSEATQVALDRLCDLADRIHAAKGEG